MKYYENKTNVGDITFGLSHSQSSHRINQSENIISKKEIKNEK